MSLKASIIPKLYFNESWFSSQLLQKAHPMFEKKYFPFLQLKNIQYGLLQNIFAKISGYLAEALMRWLQFQYHPPDNVERVLQQILWLNSSILLKGNLIFFENMFNAGIMFLNDIVEEGKILPYTEVKKKFGNIGTLQQYNQLVGSIPQTWKKKIRSTYTSHWVCRPSMKVAKWTTKLKINNIMYRFFLVDNKFTEVPFKFMIYWEGQLDTPIPWKCV